MSLLVVAGGLCFAARARNHTPAKGASAGPAEVTRIVEFVRERWGMADSVKVTATPFRDADLPGYLETTLTVNNGQQTQNQTVFWSKADKRVIVGNLIRLSGGGQGDLKDEIVQRVRNAYSIPPATVLTGEAPHSSDFPGFEVTTITADNGKGKQSQDAFITQDHRFVLLGSIFTLLTPNEVLRKIAVKNQPASGPAAAPVTIVEYADLQCPHCAKMHDFVEKELLPKYGSKIRFVYKEFPLPLHDWAKTAAVANQCAYQINPSAYVNYRSLIFQHQAELNVANLHDRLLSLGEQAGIDRVKLGGCVDSQATLARVQQDMDEGKKLQVMSTPTFFVNGKLVMWSSNDAFFKAVDEALSEKSKMRG